MIVVWEPGIGNIVPLLRKVTCVEGYHILHYITQLTTLRTLHCYQLYMLIACVKHAGERIYVCAEYV